MTSFFVPGGNVHGSGCRFGVRFFVSGSPDFIILLTRNSLIFIYFRLYLCRTMILLSESVASRASER